MAANLESTARLYTRVIRPAVLARQKFTMNHRLLTMLDACGIDNARLAPFVLETIAKFEDEAQAVQAIVNVLGSLPRSKPAALAERAQKVAEQVRPHLRQPTMPGWFLDFGCGDGEITRLLAPNEVAVLYDPTDCRSPRVKSRFGWSARQDLFCQRWGRVEEIVRREGRFHTALALTVLHHTEDPTTELWRLHSVANRLIIIESVVSPLNSEPVQAFVDWFYNRCLHEGAAIPVPGNFRTVSSWQQSFNDADFRLVEKQDLGIDLPICPEHHVLFVLDRR